MNTIKECFDTILRGDEKESRLAARMVSKILYKATASSDRSKYNEIHDIITGAADFYSKIAEDWRQENFVMAVSVIYFLHGREDQPDFLFPWLFRLLQNSNGYIRYSAVKMISHEIGPLTVHIRIPDFNSRYTNEIKPEQVESILYSLFAGLNGLSAALWQPKYERYKYIDSLPASPYKSVQMVLAELEESCGREYTDRLARRYHREFNDNIGVS